MEIILQNPYRVLGLLVGSSTRDRERQVKKLKRFIEAEQTPEEDYSFPVLGGLSRTIEQVDEAAAKLNLDRDRLEAALFWFWNGNPVTDEAAFEFLKDGDIQGAREIWERLIFTKNEEGKKEWKPISEKNLSAYHNYSLLNLLNSNGKFVDGIKMYINFLENDLIQKFVATVVDDSYQIEKKELQLWFLNRIYKELESNKSSLLSQLLNAISEWDFSAREEFLQGTIQKRIETIEQMLEWAKNERKTRPSRALEVGEELYRSTVEELVQIKRILGSGNTKYTALADKVANEVLQCGIDYYNYHHERNSDIDYVEPVVNLAKKAEDVAVGSLVRSRIQENLKIIEMMKDKELLTALEFLREVKQTYERNRQLILAEIERQLLFRTGFGLRQHWNINWGEVERLIDASINWDKVVDLVLEIIPPQNVEKIKKSDKKELLNEYRSLVNFLFSKLNGWQKSRISYIIIPERIEKSSPLKTESKKTHTETVTSKTTSSPGGSEKAKSTTSTSQTTTTRSQTKSQMHQPQTTFQRSKTSSAKVQTSNVSNKQTSSGTSDFSQDILFTITRLILWILIIFIFIKACN